MNSVIDIFAQLETPSVQRKLFAQLEQKYTYGQLTQDVRKLTTFFKQKGIAQGQRIIISSANNYGVAILFWTCLRNGITAILLDPEIGNKRANELIDTCAPSYLFIDAKNQEKWSLSKWEERLMIIGEQSRRRGSLLKKLLKKPRPTEKSTVADTLWTNLQALTPTDDLPVSIAPETIAYILFTSGSTATPKAVQISHKALWTNLKTVLEVYEMDEDSRIFNILTIYHTDGIIQGPVLSAFATATWYHPMEFSVNNIPNIFDAFYTYEITHFLTVPTLLNFLYQFSEGFEDTFNNDSFKHIICSAAPLEPKFWDEFERKFGIELVNVYGLTETIAGASYCSSVTQSRKIGSVGKPIDCEFKIVDSDYNEVASGEEGELLIKGDNVFSGYLNNREASAEAFRDGWFCTGDLAICDPNGIYKISGRKKNLVISGGINIQPEEVMASLNAHPAVSESACVGIPDDVFGEILVAVIVLQQNQTIDEAKLSDHCRQELEEAKVPKQYFFVDSLPKTGSGKVKYAAVKEQLSNQQLQVGQSDGSNAGLRTQITEIAAKSFKCSPASIDFNSASTTTVDGWDSLAHLSFVTNLEAAFNIHLNAKEIMKVATLVDAERILKQKV